MRGAAWFPLALAAALQAASPAAAEVVGHVYGAGGAPLAGARVAAYTPETSAARHARLVSPRPERQPAAGPSGPLVAVADAAGRFVLPVVPAAILHVEATAEGHVPAQQALLPGDETVVLSLERGRTVTGQVLGEGRPVAGAAVVWTRRDDHHVVARTDARGRYRLVSPQHGLGAVAVYHPDWAPLEPWREQRAGEPLELERGRAVAGRVVDGGGRPVVGATVTAMGLPLATSDAAGRFAIAHLPERARRLEATAGERVAEATLADGEVRLVAGAGATIGGTVTLRRASGAAAPLAGATVTLQTLDREGAVPRVFVTGADGRWGSGPLPPGRYSVMAARELERRVRLDASTRAMADGDAQVVELRAGQRATRDAELLLPPRVHGTVVDAAGRPVGGAAVGLLPETEAAAAIGWDPEQPRTDGAGRFSLPLLWIEGPSRLTVAVVRAGHSPYRSGPVEVGGRQEVRVDVRLPAELPLVVRVTAADGSPIAGARVAFAADEEGARWRPPIESLLAQPSLWVASAADGAARLHLAAGSYELGVDADGYQLATRDVQVGARVPRDPVVFALEPAVEIRGRVVRSGRGLPGVHVHPQTAGRAGEEPARTAEDGTFVVRNLAPGEHRLIFVRPDEMLHEERQVVAPATDVLVELPAAGTIAGTAVDRTTGAPVEGVVVEVQADGRLAEAQPSRPRRHGGGRGTGGRFELLGVPVGEVVVVAAAQGYLPSEPRRVVVRDGETTEVAFDLDPGAALAGRVTGDDGEPLAGATLVAVPARPDRGAPPLRVGPPSATSDVDGGYRLTGLAAGTVLLTVQREGYVAHRDEVEVSGDTRADVRMSRGLSLSGTVVAGGEPVAGAQVGATTATVGASHQAATTDERGRFTLTGLLPARHTVSAYKEGYRSREVPGVEPQAGRPLVIDLSSDPPAVLWGVVAGLPAPQAGVKVTLRAVTAYGDHGGADGVIQPDGTYRVENLPAGVLRVQARVETTAGSQQSRPVTVEVAPGDEARVDLDLTPALVVEGTVTADDRPLAGATVVFNSRESPGATARTDAGGRYSLPLPAPGTYQVYVHHERRARTQHQSVHTITASQQLDIELGERTLAGTVTDAATGDPLPRAVVTAFTGGAGGDRLLAAETVTDGNGRFRLNVGVSGALELLVGAPGYGQAHVEAAGEEELAVALERVEGAVVRVVEVGSGMPLQAHLVVRDAAGAPLPARTQELPDGSHEVSLAPGSYLLTAIVPGYGQRTIRLQAPGEGVVEMGPGGDLLVELPPEARGSLAVFDAAGVLNPPCCEGTEWPLTGGLTALRSLAAGSYTVELRDLAGRTVSRGVAEVRPGAAARLRLE